MLQNLRIRNAAAWKITAERILFLLHKYGASEFAVILSIFNKVTDLDLGDD